MLFRKEKMPDDIGERLRHIAFIMDGNGRWATRRGLPRRVGHMRGAENFRRVVRQCRSLGIGTVTVYAFSTENWSRPKSEVDALMELLRSYLQEALSSDLSEGTRVVILGDKTPFEPEFAAELRELEARTADAGPFTLNIALNYGARDEIARAFSLLAAEGRTEITPADISAHLYTASSPDPDLVVRTGGDYRISNFLLFQSAYAEYCFTKTLWPDFGGAELNRMVADFCHRHRRYGGL